jgi:hypothetical protein
MLRWRSGRAARGTTSALNQAVRRNIERFPKDFAFQLSKEEFENCRSQIVISNPAAKTSSSMLMRETPGNWQKSTLP